MDDDIRSVIGHKLHSDDDSETIPNLYPPNLKSSARHQSSKFTNSSAAYTCGRLNLENKFEIPSLPTPEMSKRNVIVLNQKKEHRTALARSESEVKDQIMSAGNLKNGSNGAQFPNSGFSGKPSKPTITNQPKHKLSKSKMGEFISVDPFSSFKSYDPDVPPGTEYLVNCNKFRIQLCNDVRCTKEDDKLRVWWGESLAEELPSKVEGSPQDIPNLFRRPV